MESKLDIAKKIIEEQYEYYRCGIFNSRNTAGDHMCTIYNENGLVIDVCDDWEYFEVFGLTQKEFNELSDFYDKLRGGRENDRRKESKV